MNESVVHIKVYEKSSFSINYSISREEQNDELSFLCASVFNCCLKKGKFKNKSLLNL